MAAQRTATTTHLNTQFLNTCNSFRGFSIVVRFVATRLDGDVPQERCTKALLTALPASVRARSFGQLVLNLALRIRLPADDVLQPDAATRAEHLLDSVRSAMRTDDNGALMAVADEFIALAVRAYDGIANELRWLVVPRALCGGTFSAGRRRWRGATVLVRRAYRPSGQP
jgi:hypothetical protein